MRTGRGRGDADAGTDSEGRELGGVRVGGMAGEEDGGGVGRTGVLAGGKN
jgi:hypothetical protein